MEICRLRRMLVRLRNLAVLAGLVGCLLAAPACNPEMAKPPPPPVAPSVVVTRDGIAFYVKNLRLPGTRQELRLKEGGTLTWVPLEQVAAVQLSGPIHDDYRHATVVLTGGQEIHGELYINFLIEGTTDLGYWNMPMRKVARLELAFD
jgi:hypothetical protein